MNKIDKFAFIAGGVAAVGLLCVLIFNTSKTVTLSSKDFVCVDAEPFNLETRCMLVRTGMSHTEAEKKVREDRNRRGW